MYGSFPVRLDQALSPDSCVFSGEIEMVQSNHSVLGEGLRMYTNAIGQFVKQRLETAFRDNWWQEGVIKAFYYPRRHLENDEAKNRVELLDPSAFVDIISRNRDLFRDTFPNRKETDSLLVQASEARNIWDCPGVLPTRSILCKIGFSGGLNFAQFRSRGTLAHLRFWMTRVPVSGYERGSSAGRQGGAETFCGGGSH